MKQIGLGLAVAVLIDATVVRMVLVPAVMELLGKANWSLPRLLGVHESLRQFQRRLRTGLGSSRSDPGKTGHSLRVHCVAFCSAMARHPANGNSGPKSPQRCRSGQAHGV